MSTRTELHDALESVRQGQSESRQVYVDRLNGTVRYHREPRGIVRMLFGPDGMAQEPTSKKQKPDSSGTSPSANKPDYAPRARESLLAWLKRLPKGSRIKDVKLPDRRSD